VRPNGYYSLVGTCEANDVNPIDYLRDVLLRISAHPADRIDALLPDRWKPAESASLIQGRPRPDAYVSSA
jgi:hypothetical protein